MWQAIIWNNDVYFTDPYMRHSVSMSLCCMNPNPNHLQTQDMFKPIMVVRTFASIKSLADLKYNFGVRRAWQCPVRGSDT